MCIYTDNVSNKEVFQVLFPRFVWEGKYETLCTQLVQKECSIKIFVLQIYCTSCNSVFPMWHFHPNFACSLYSLIQDLRYSQWWGFIMRPGLGHCVVWYMVMNVLEVHSGSVFTGSRKMLAVCADWNHADYTVPYLEDCNLNLNILYCPCIEWVLQTNWIYVLSNKYNLLFYVIFWSEENVGENIM
jgi:hypothetical protein